MPPTQQNGIESGQLPDQVKARFAASLSNTKAEIFYPSTVGYDNLVRRWSDNSEKLAAAVILPRTVEDIAKVVNVSRENDIPFVVAGGRHSTSGSSSIQDGVVIDLREMRKVIVDKDAKTITAEGGCLWEDVDREAAKFGLATVGGTVNHTGVGGLTLGGGYGWLSGRYGLTIDNLISAKMVLGDGRIVIASEDSNPDLFWAVRGAGQCFGVAAEFVFRAYPQGDTWGGLMAFTPDKLAKIVDFGNWFHENTNGDQGLGFGFSTPPGAPTVLVLTALFFNGEETEAVKYFKPLLDLEPMVNHTGVMHYYNLNGMLNDAVTPGGRKVFGGSNIAMPLDPKFVQSVYDEMVEFVNSHEGTKESLLLFELFSYIKTIKVGVDETACANRGEYYNVGTLFRWYSPELDSEVRLFNRKINARIKEQAGTKKAGGVGIYSNYLHTSRTPDEVFGSNTAKLKELKLKYDPDNLFRSWHNLLPN